MITLRPASTTDATFIAEGIYAAFLIPEHSPHKQEWLKILTNVCEQPDTHYSYTNTIIAEYDDCNAGMMIAVDGRHYRQQRNTMSPQLKNIFDLVFGLDWEKMEDEAQSGEFYIDSLSVSPNYQGKGIGSQLIRHAIQRAQQLSIPRITLAVEPNNPAKRLYTNLGFHFDHPIVIFNDTYHLYSLEIPNVD